MPWQIVPGGRADDGGVGLTPIPVTGHGTLWVPATGQTRYVWLNPATGLWETLASGAAVTAALATVPTPRGVWSLYRGMSGSSDCSFQLEGLPRNALPGMYGWTRLNALIDTDLYFYPAAVYQVTRDTGLYMTLPADWSAITPPLTLSYAGDAHSLRLRLAIDYTAWPGSLTYQARGHVLLDCIAPLDASLLDVLGDVDVNRRASGATDWSGVTVIYGGFYSGGGATSVIAYAGVVEVTPSYSDIWHPASHLEYADSGETGVATALLRVYVYLARGAIRQPLAIWVGHEVAVARARAPLRVHAWRPGRAVAPLCVALRNPRYALREVVPSFPALDSAKGAAWLPLVANVYDTVAAGMLNPAQACGTGLKACPGLVCANVPLGWPAEYWQSMCSLPQGPEPGESGSLYLHLAVLVLPTAASLDWGDLAAFDRLVGYLEVPWQRVGRGPLLEYFDGTSWNWSQGPYPYAQDQYNYPFNTQNLWLGGYGFNQTQRVIIAVYPHSNGIVWTPRLASMQPGHLRIDTPWYRLEVWPDGVASYIAWAADRIGFPSVAGVQGSAQGGTDGGLGGGISPLRCAAWLPNQFVDGYYNHNLYEGVANTQVVDTLLEDTAFYGGNRAAALLHFRVGLRGQAVAPLLIGVGTWRGRARLLLICAVGHGEGAASAALALAVHPAGVPAAAWWGYALRIAGVEVWHRVTGDLRVEAEAGTARIADFRLAPQGVPLTLADLVMAPVEIDCWAPGGAPTRLFSGWIVEADFDAETGALACVASDERKRLLDLLPASGIAALTPGALHSPAVQGEGLAGAALAEACLSTLAADLDLSTAGVFRLTPWAAAATPAAVFTESGIVDGSLAVRLMRVSDAMNQVECRFQYRYPLLKERQAECAWDYASCAGSWLLAGGNPFFLREADIRAAAEQDGWRVTRFESGTPAGNNLRDASFALARRHAQTVTETATLSVRAPLSEAAHGQRPGGPLSASLEVDYAADGWADHPERAPFPALPAGEPRVAITTQEADGRGVADAAIRALLAQARRDILASLRGNRVAFTTPLRPDLDLPHTLRVETARVTAQGRVARLTHILDAQGAAITEVELALFGTPGTNPAETPLDPPAPPALPAPDLAGFTVAFGGAVVEQGTPEPDWEAPGFSVFYRTYWSDSDPETPPNPDTLHIEAIRAQFRVTLPAVPDADSQPLAPPVAAEYLVGVPVDDFTLIA